MKSEIKYIEYCNQFNHRGLAWVARVRFSKSGQTVYFNGRSIKHGSGVVGNHYDLETGEEYWVSGVKKKESNRHWAGGGKIQVERGVLREFLEIKGWDQLDT